MCISQTSTTTFRTAVALGTCGRASRPSATAGPYYPFVTLMAVLQLCWTTTLGLSYRTTHIKEDQWPGVLSKHSRCEKNSIRSQSAASCWTRQNFWQCAQRRCRLADRCFHQYFQYLFDIKQHHRSKMLQDDYHCTHGKETTNQWFNDYHFEHWCLSLWSALRNSSWRTASPCCLPPRTHCSLCFVLMNDMIATTFHLDQKITYIRKLFLHFCLAFN